MQVDPGYRSGASRRERGAGALGLFLILVLGAAADRLGGAPSGSLRASLLRLIVASIGAVGRLCDHLGGSSHPSGPQIVHRGYGR